MYVDSKISCRVYEKLVAALTLIAVNFKQNPVGKMMFFLPDPL